jgi:hypothetical protein
MRLWQGNSSNHHLKWVALAVQQWPHAILLLSRQSSANARRSAADAIELALGASLLCCEMLQVYVYLFICCLELHITCYLLITRNLIFSVTVINLNLKM